MRVLGQAAASDPAASVETLQSLCARQQFARGGEIYAEGSRSKHWYQVITGTVRLTNLMVNGGRLVGGFYYEGDCFGFDLGGSRIASAEAVDEVVVCRYPHQAIDRLMATQPQLATQLWNSSLRSLDRAVSHTTLLARMTAPMRIAKFLLDLSERQHGSLLLNLPMTRIDVADYLGMTVETVCRVLSRFAEIQFIAVPNTRQIELIDLHALKTIVIDGFDRGHGQWYEALGTRAGRALFGS